MTDSGAGDAGQRVASDAGAGDDRDPGASQGDGDRGGARERDDQRPDAGPREGNAQGDQARQADQAKGGDQAGQGADGDGQRADTGPFVPSQAGSSARASNDRAAEKSTDGAAETASVAERSVARIKALQSGKEVPEGKTPRHLEDERSTGLADELRNERAARASEDLLVDNRRGKMTHGPYSPIFQQETTIVNGSRQVRVLKAKLSAARVRALRHPHVRVDNFAQISAALDSQRVIVLQGLPGSGRLATAVNVLAERGISEIRTLDIEPETSLPDIHGDELLEPAGGYVIEVTSEIRQATLASFNSLATEHGSYLVITSKPARPGTERLTPYAFDHPAAPAMAVLREHCVEMLRHHTCEQECSDLSNRRYAERRLGEIEGLDDFSLDVRRAALVDLARVLADNIHSGAATADLVKRDRGQLRQIAAEALTVTSGEGSIEEPRLQGFRLAYGVFNGFPLADVFEAGALLSQVILPEFEKRETPPDHVVFDGKLSQLLPDDLYVPGARPADGVEAPRRAELVDSALTRLLLDVAWHDFDALRMPILAWIDALAGHERLRIRVRAAQVAGILATFDFDELNRMLFRFWARGWIATRQSAALALEQASYDERLVVRIRRQVRDWAASPDPRLQDTAARAYGRSIGTTMPGDAILALRELASKPDLLYSNAIAISMTNLFAVSAEDVVKELALWTGGANEYRRRHAARVLLVLSRFAGPKAKDDGWPAMPGVSAADGTFRSLLAQTWVDALAGTDTAGRAWDALRRWIMDADGAPELEDTVVSLAIEILRRSTTERRRFHLLHWRLKHPESSVLKRIHDAIDRRSTNLA